MIRERNQIFKLNFILLDLFMSTFAYLSSVLLRFFVMEVESRVASPLSGYQEWSTVIPSQDQAGIILLAYLPLGILIVVMQAIAFSAIDLYRPRRGVFSAGEFIDIVKGVLLSLSMVLAILFFYRGTSFSRIVILYTAVFGILYHSLGHYIARSVMARLRLKGYHTRDILLVGTGETASRFIDVIDRHPLYGYRIQAILGSARGAGERIRNLLRGSEKDLEKVFPEVNPDLIVYASSTTSGKGGKMMREVVEFCDREGVDCRIVPDLVDLVTHRARIDDLDGLPMLSLRDTPLKNGYNRFLKRIFDIVFASFVLILISPILLVIMILIKLDSPGPIFFVQERVGLDRRNFKVIKFRTMRQQAKKSSDTTWGSKNDDRVTKLGKFLRKSSIDELPQFINVLLGDMSVVGPRPERPHFVQEFKSRYAHAHYMRRHSARAGITGWAQIKGYRGDTSIEKRVELDIYYIENWSFWFDIRIILSTVPALISNPGE